jgi:hypothetical protein
MGVEVYLKDVTQYGSLEESVGTEQIRSNLPERMCFQTETRAHGTFALGEDAHSKVDTTKLAKKGQFFYRADSETESEMMRAPHVPHKLARQIAVRNAEVTGRHERYLELYATNWQETYDMRWTRLPMIFWNDAPQTAGLEDAEHVEQSAAPAPPPRQPDEIDRQVADINAEIDEAPAVTTADIALAMELRAARGEGPPDLRADHDQRRRLLARLLQAAGPDGITPVQLSKGSGIGRTMTFQLLGQLTEAGVVIKKGAEGSRAVRYVATGDVRAAMIALDEAAGRLAAEARELAGV